MKTYLAHIKVARLYEKLQSSIISTNDRKKIYHQILHLLILNEKLESFWLHQPNAYRYVDKIVKIKDFDLIAKQKDAEAYAYIALLVDQNLVKVGKTKRLIARQNELIDKYGTTCFLETFAFSNEEDAYIMEVLLHKYFKKQPQSIFIPQDRFDRITCSDEDLDILRKAAQKIRTIDWFADTSPKKL